MRDLWFQDIMMQKFLDGDATRILMLYAMIDKGLIKNEYRKKGILEYIYRCYSDNNALSSINPNFLVRNIDRYGLSDIKDLLEQALNEWKHYSRNGILQSDDRSIYLNIKDEEEIETLPDITKQIADMLYKEYFEVPFYQPKVVEPNQCMDDENLEVFGRSLYKRRLLEDMQYCPLCEETNLDNLYAVHILPSRYCDNSERIDKNNGLIMCKVHAYDYIKKKFAFKENGFVTNRDSSNIEKGMHLSLEIKNKERRGFISRYYEIYNGDNLGENS